MPVNTSGAIGVKPMNGKSTWATLWILYVEFYRNTHWEQKERHVVVLTVPPPNIRNTSSLASYCAKCSKPTNKKPWFYQQICSYIIHLSYAKLSTKSNKPFRLEWWKWFIWRKSVQTPNKKLLQTKSVFLFLLWLTTFLHYHSLKFEWITRIIQW